MNPAVEEDHQNDDPLGVPKFFQVPPEVRTKQILGHLSEADRKVLRTVCSQLAFEIDNFVGPIDHVLTLREDFSPEMVDFYSRTYFPYWKINSNLGSMNNFSNIIPRPFNVKGFGFELAGVINPEFAQNILNDCKKLECLAWCGTVTGRIAAGPPLVFPNLQVFQVSGPVADTHALQIQSLRSNPPRTLQQILHDRENQLCLLNRLQCPRLLVAIFRLNTHINEFEEVHDEFELHSGVFGFLRRHPGLGKILVFENIDYTRNGLPDHPHCLNYYKALEANEPFEIPTLHLPEQGELKIIEFLLSSSWPLNKGPDGQQPTHNWLNFLQRLDTLEKLEIDWEPSHLSQIPWGIMGNVITHNCRTLVEVVIIKYHGFSTPISFRSFADCTSLRYLDLNVLRRTIDVVDLDLVQDFGPYQSMIDNLEELSLCNIGLQQKDMDSLCEFKMLEKLQLQILNCPKGYMSCGCFQNILGMRNLETLSLQGVYLLRPPMWTNENENMSMSTFLGLENVFNMYQEGSAHFPY